MPILRRLHPIIKQAGTSSESDTSRDGILSYSAETHAVAHGLYDSFKTWHPVARDLPDTEDVQAEPHYYKGTYILGSLLQLAILVAIAYIGFPRKIHDH